MPGGKRLYCGRRELKIEGEEPWVRKMEMSARAVMLKTAKDYEDRDAGMSSRGRGKVLEEG